MLNKPKREFYKLKIHFAESIRYEKDIRQF